MRGETEMETYRYHAKVLKDGHISLPRDIREKLDIVFGDKVEITIQLVKEKQEKLENNPLYKIIGLCDEGKSDGSVEHDKYLYKEQAE